MTPEERAVEITKGWGPIRVDRPVLMEMTGSDSPYLVIENGGEWARAIIASAIESAVTAERERCARVVAFCVEHDPNRLPVLAQMLRAGFDVRDLSGPPKDIDFPQSDTNTGGES